LSIFNKQFKKVKRKTKKIIVFAKKHKRALGVSAGIGGTVIGTSILLLNLIVPLLWSSYIANYSRITAVDVNVYTNSSKIEQLTIINWGDVAIGETYDKEMFAVNEGYLSITLSLRTENWNPSNVSDYLLLSWDYFGEVILSGNGMNINISLYVSDNTPDSYVGTSFSFDIVIVGA